MKIKIERFDGYRIKKFVIEKSHFGFRWKVKLSNNHIIYPLDGWPNRKEAEMDFIENYKDWEKEFK